MSEERRELRGVFCRSDEPAYWRKATESFDNKVPRFDSKDEAVAFTKENCKHPAGVKPEFQHSISLLATWGQIEEYLIPKIKEYDHKSASSKTSRDICVDGNRFYKTDNGGKCILEYVKSRLDLKVHDTLVPIESSLNTLKYLFFHMKCGIYVMVRNSQLVIFCPFANEDYQNSWGPHPKIESEDGTVDSYTDLKRRVLGSKDEESTIPKEQWWANGNIICNQSGPQLWGDHFLFQLKDMLAETCNRRQIPDCEFFVNKRDYPQLKYNMDRGVPVEPYGFIFDKDDRRPEEDVDLADNLYRSYAPILSFYTSDRFADIPFPPSEDWEAATGKVFPPSFKYEKTGDTVELPNPPRDLFTTANLEKFKVAWEDKVSTAFFRGSATGGGVTVETNQRLHIAYLSAEWAKAVPQETDGTSTSYVPYLDAKIVGWNRRDKKIASSRMTFIKKDAFPFVGKPKENFVEIYKQSTYKYLVYVEGHCAACRYGFMMLLGSVILKVDSRCVADQMWYFPLLVPYEDHVPVQADLSDLREKIEWCRNNDARCRQIAENARRLHDSFICREGILDYLQGVFLEIAKKQVRPPAWASVSPAACTSVPKCDARVGQYCDDKTFCSVCKELKAMFDQSAAQKVAESKKHENKEDDRKAKALRKRLEKIEEIRKQRDSLIGAASLTGVGAASPSLSGVGAAGVEDIASHEPVGKRVKTELT